MQLKPIDQQVVALVGASSGIGRETALRFAKRGAKLVVAARSEEGLQSLVQEITQAGGVATYVVADVSDFEQVQAIADAAIATYGRLDTWVHNAAIELYAAFEQTSPEEFKRIIDVNLMGQVYGAMVALPHLKQTGQGSLIHVTSVEARRSLPLQSAYAASKHAVDGFIESLRVELMHDNVLVSVTEILPASINTPLFSKARTKLGVKPMGVPPIYEPEIVADAILYAAEHPVRDIVVGDAGKLILLGQSVSPALVDLYMEKTAFDGQRTEEPKSEDAPDNLEAPLSGFDRVKGDFSDQAQSVSVSNWLDTHPVTKWGALAGMGAIALAMLASQAVKGDNF